MPRPIATNSRIKQDEKYRKDMHLAFVNNALQEKVNGKCEPFEELVNQFNPKSICTHGPPPSSQLRLWILALSHVVSRLERPHATLVEAIVSMPWTTMDEAFVKSYSVFIGMLLSARPEYLSLVLGKIAQGFTHQFGLQALNAGQPEGSSSPLTRRIIYDRIHYLLQHLLSLIPTLPNTLQPLLARNFPHKRQNLIAQVTYIRNLLRVTEYCPELGDRIMATIIDRALQIDVEIQVESEELEELMEEEMTEDPSGVFELDPFETTIGLEGTESDSDDGDDAFSDLSSEAEDLEDDAGGDELSDVRHIHDMINKLDSILKLIFDYYNRAHSTSSPIIPNSYLLSHSSEPSGSSSPTTYEGSRALRRAQFHTLLSIFDRSIIRTFKSRYTQFLVFWYASLDPEFSDLFQGMLVEKALISEDQPSVTRAAAASYIASFVSRAQFVDRQGTRRVTAVLCDFLRGHLDVFDVVSAEGTAQPSIAHHSVFYAVAQAVFLIFCFRWRDLLEQPDDKEGDDSSSAKQWMTELNVIQRVITSALNPLKVCSANVVMQFARVARATNFIYCYSIMEANKRSEYNSTNDNNAKHSNQPPLYLAVLGSSMHAELNTFFPFDPFKLPKSHSYIEGVYREWSSVAIDDEEAEEDNDKDQDEQEADGEWDTQQNEMRRRISIPHTQNVSQYDAGILGASFEGMSISPARPSGLIAVSAFS